MELKQLEYFIKAVELGSLSKAAYAMHIAQSAFSLHIARLEKEVGCQLFTRSSQGVVPTERGLRFYRQARGALIQINGLKLIGRGAEGNVQGHVTLGVPVSVAQMLSVDFVGALRKRYPGIMLCMIEYPSSHLAELLVNRRLDLALLYVEQVPRGIDALPVLVEDFYVIDAAAGWTAKERRLRTLHRQPVVLPAVPNSVRTNLERACSALDIELNVVAECSSPATMIRLAQAGIGATVLPLSALHSCPDMKGTVPALLIEPTLSRTLALCRATEAPKEPPLLAVQETLLAVFHRLLHSGGWQGARPI
ncbi:MAG: LysR substrate-binding domain-containing protein [Pollutimonas bauzanensis]